MLRGVNKQIVEVNNTGNRYFEKAILFVNPQYADISRHKLDVEANKYIESLGNAASGNYKDCFRKLGKKSGFRTALLFCVSAVLLILAVYILLL